MSTSLDNIPESMRSTYRLLKSAYPDAIPEEDYYPLLALMKETGMSDRSVATAIGLYYTRNYTDYLYDVAHELPHRGVHSGEKKRVKGVLLSHGFEQWAEED